MKENTRVKEEIVEFYIDYQTDKSCQMNKFGKLTESKAFWVFYFSDQYAVKTHFCFNYCSAF